MIDIAIIGNGAVGMNASIYLKTKLPKKKITLFGNKEQKNSASVASGAMLCPIEQRNFSKSKNLKFDNNFYYQKSCDSIKIYKSIQKKIILKIWCKPEVVLCLYKRKQLLMKKKHMNL